MNQLKQEENKHTKIIEKHLTTYCRKYNNSEKYIASQGLSCIGMPRNIKDKEFTTITF